MWPTAAEIRARWAKATLNKGRFLPVFLQATKETSAEPLNASVADPFLLLLCLIIGAEEEHICVLSEAAGGAPVRNARQTRRHQVHPCKRVLAWFRSYSSMNPTFVCCLMLPHDRCVALTRRQNCTTHNSRGLQCADQAGSQHTEDVGSAVLAEMM